MLVSKTIDWCIPLCITFICFPMDEKFDKFNSLIVLKFHFIIIYDIVRKIMKGLGSDTVNLRVFQGMNNCGVVHIRNIKDGYLCII